MMTMLTAVLAPVQSANAALVIMDGSADLLVGTARDEIEAAIAIAKTSLGLTDYVWGGAHIDDYTQLNFPYIDTDCSGFVRAAYVRGGGVEFGQGTTTTFKNGQFAKYNKPLSEAQRGDLIMSYGDSHISLYLGNGLQIESTGFGGGGGLGIGDRLTNGGILIQPIASSGNIGSILDMNMFLEHEEGKLYKRVAPQEIMYTGQVVVPTLEARLNKYIESGTIPAPLSLTNELPKERELRLYREQQEQTYVREMINQNNGVVTTIEEPIEPAPVEQKQMIDGAELASNINEQIRDLSEGRPVEDVDSALLDEIINEALSSMVEKEPVPVNPNQTDTTGSDSDEQWVIG